jgi:hypothetical protein
MDCTQQDFERVTADHQMTVYRDDGVERHLSFRDKDGSSSYWFEILTWPGALCIRGDCGTYVFSRTRDMFEFFRQGMGNDPSRLRINPSYWMEKLQAVNSCGYGEGAAKRFSEQKFRRNVVHWFRRHTDPIWHPEAYEHRWAIWKTIREEVLERVDSHDPSYNFTLLNDFEVWIDVEMKFRHKNFFDEFWELDCKDYDHSFLWNCYAIAWAIRQYDSHHAALEVQS